VKKLLLQGNLYRVQGDSVFMFPLQLLMIETAKFCHFVVDGLHSTHVGVVWWHSHALGVA